MSERERGGEEGKGEREREKKGGKGIREKIQIVYQ